MTRLLLDETPLFVLPSLAARIGLDEAILLQQIHYIQMLNEQNKIDRYFLDDRWWVSHSAQDWHKICLWLTPVTVQRRLDDLEKLTLIAVRKGVGDPMDRTKWVSINYDRLDLVAAVELPIDQNGSMDRSKLINDLYRVLDLKAKIVDSKDIDLDQKKDSLRPDGRPATFKSQGPKGNLNPRKRKPIGREAAPGRPRLSPDAGAAKPRKETPRGLLWEGVIRLWGYDPKVKSDEVNGVSSLAGDFVSHLLSALETPPTVEQVKTFNTWINVYHGGIYGRGLKDKKKYAAYWSEWLRAAKPVPAPEPEPELPPESDDPVWTPPQAPIID